MKSISKAALALALLLSTLTAFGQTPVRPAQEPGAAEAAAEKAFDEGNALMEQRKFADALARYREGLRHLPDDSSLLYNASTAALLAGDFAAAAPYLTRLVAAYPDDWQSRAKLIQTHQALGDLKARDAERAALFELRKRGGGRNEESPELSLARQDAYCRERMEVKGRQVMAFEHFELKGERALRYAFVVLDEAGGREAYRISLGSYDMTNSFWAASNKEKAARGGRLFHLDGYFPGGHATYGMYHPEPTYDEVRATVVKILEGKQDPVSSSTVRRPPPAPAEQKKP
ncbi:MAG TPA: tetratricopeptide repeat protein [Pyrinomonadaceae bacterium]|nr:tetratricopeptide repeat protein [Pyrinomonadaceae bacterium]